MKSIKLPPQLRKRWELVTPRDKSMLLLGAGVMGFSMIWWLLLSPAISVLKSADEQHRQLNAQLQSMSNLAAQAQALQSRPKVSFDDAKRMLDTLVKNNFGDHAQVAVAGERATVTLKAVAPEVLISWLTQVRVDARALPIETKLTRNTSATTAVWDGVVVLALPPP